MDVKKKRIIHISIIVGIIILVALIITLAVVLSSKEDKQEEPEKKSEEKEKEEEVDIVNSYNNTDELIKKYPVVNPTTVKAGLEEKIQNRLLTGFENWNRGFKAWKAWGNILYTQDSIYNVHGVRLTLAHYQESMDVALKQTNIIMGAFHNMLICDEFTAIYYDFVTVIGNNRVNGTVMEFVKFKDYEGELGTRVVEGWGSTKDNSYDGMLNFQGPEEKKVQQEQLDYMLKYEIPETDNLREKYLIKNPTNYTDDNAEKILDIILKGFDSWNNGISEYLNWLSIGYDEDAKSCDLQSKNRTMSEYKEEMKALVEKENIKKIYFDNILIRDNWAALHYRYTNENLSTKEITAGDRMQFLKFEQKGENLKIVASFIQ